MPQAVVVSSIIGIGAFVAAGANWLRVARRTERIHGANGAAIVDDSPAPSIAVTLVNGPWHTTAARVSSTGPTPDGPGTRVDQPASWKLTIHWTPKRSVR